MLAEQEVMVKKLSDFKEKHKGEKSESVAALLTRLARQFFRSVAVASREVKWNEPADACLLGDMAGLVSR